MDPQVYMDPELYSAAKLGDTTILSKVVKANSDRLLRPTRQGNTAIHVSVRAGHIGFVMEVYDALLRPNSSLEGDTDYSRSLSLLTRVNSVGDTALHVAAREGHASIVEYLIGKILPWPSEQDVERGNASLARNRLTEVAREKIRMRNNRNHTALHEAVQRNGLVMVKLLTEADPDLGHPNYAADANAHADADADAEADAEAVLLRVLESPRRRVGESPLYRAARNGYLDIVNQILLICPSAAHGGPRGQTALHSAAAEGHLDVVKTLLEKKGELVKIVDDKGRTALHDAASKKCHRVVQLLLSHDTSSMYLLDEDGYSPLHIAAKESSLSVFRELIHAYPESVELASRFGYNVLHLAVESNDYKKIKFVLQQQEYQELVNQPDFFGDTPFHLASRAASLGIVKLLSSNSRVDVKARNDNGITASEIKKKRMEEEAARDIKREKELEKTLQIVASLIATVTFAAVFQVPGGYNSSGTPVLQDNGSFQLFLVFDALAMSTSVASLVIMLVASFGTDLFYTLSLLAAKFLIYAALIFTSIAFLEGLRAVLPHCDSLLCFSSHSNRTFSIIAISVILSLCYVPFVFIFSLYQNGYLVRKIMESRWH